MPLEPLTLDLDLDSMLGLSPSLESPRRKRKKPAIDPQREEELLRRLLDTGVGGLQYVAESIDKPGRAVRGVLAGRPEELLNLVPFSDTLGITDPHEAVQGRDLLRQWGMVGSNQPGLDAGDVAGFFTEVALDPLTYLSFGASTALGQSAKAAGKATKGFLPAVKAGERSLVSASLPFTQTGLDFTGPAAARAGETLKSVAKKPVEFADDLLELAGINQRPVETGLDATARFARQTFDPRVGGKFGREEQALAELLHDRRYATERAFTGAARASSKVIDEGAEAFAKAMPQTPNNVPHRQLFERVARFAAEVGENDAVDDIFGPGFDHLKPLVKDTADKLRQSRDEPYARIRELGGKAEELGADPNDLLQHNPRGVDPAKLPQGAKVNRKGQSGYGFEGARHRDKQLRDVPTDILNRITNDPRTRGKGAAKYIEQTYGRWLDPLYGQVKRKGKVVSPGSGTAGHAKAIARWVKDKPQADWFNRGLGEDQARYLKGAHTSAAQLEAAQDFILKNVGATQGTPLGKLYSRTPGFDKKGAVEYVARQMGINPKDAAKLMVPDEVADAVTNALRPLSKTEGWGRTILEGVDKANDITKRLLTVPWPKFHVRNFSGGQYLNMASGLMRTAGDIGSYLKELWSVMAGKVDPQYLEEMRQLRVLGGDVTEGLSEASGADLLNAGFGRAATHGVPIGQTRPPRGSLDKINPMRLGDKAARAVETANRAPLYVWLRKRGYTPEAAAQEVAVRQFDYSDLAGGDPAFMRVFPFWNWIRRSSNLVMRTLAERPGGAMAQTIRAGESGREEAGFLPDWLGETAAIPDPFGNEDRFITKLGLPTDDVFSRLAFGATPMKTAQRTFEKAVAQSSPLIGLPYTIASGREPFFGRELRELYDYPTNDDLTNAILGKLPVARGIGTVRTLMDDRKGIGAKAVNLLSPASVTDLSGGIERQRSYSVTNALEDLLDETPHVRRYERYYVPADEKEQVDPLAAELLELADTLRARARAEAQAR